MSPENNYKAYRALEDEAKPPLIPFFGLYMKDLTFMNDGNQTVLGNDLINFEKLRTVMGKIMAIRVSQQSKYDFVPIERTLMGGIRGGEREGRGERVVVMGIRCSSDAHAHRQCSSACQSGRGRIHFGYCVT